MRRGAIIVLLGILGMSLIRSCFRVTPLAGSAAGEAAREYIAEGSSLRDERRRALYVAERMDKVLAGLDPDAEVTYDTLAKSSSEPLAQELAGRFKMALMEEALRGNIVPEDHLFDAEGIWASMRGAALARLEE